MAWARAGLLAMTVAFSCGGCGALWPARVDVDDPMAPLSKVYVTNATDIGHHVRMNWPDGFVQVAWIESGTTQGLTGAIGTSAFPSSIDVLTLECQLVTSLDGLPRGSAGIVVISARGVRLDRLDRADASWPYAPSVDACGATPTD